MEQKITLIWIYLGQDPAQRLEAIGDIDPEQVDVLAVGNAEVKRAAELYAVSRPDSSMRSLDSVSLDAIWQAVSPESQAMVFWFDDEKIVGRSFAQDMAAPLAGRGPRAGDRHLHYWDGNALAVSRSLAESLALEDLNLRDHSLLTILSDVVDRGVQFGKPKFKVMFSPLERFSAIDAEPVGLAS